ncbi:MAG: hypothetical protein M3N43_05255, partial [Actinomycetota bacterium]|nr:hypothetical protein [Actinomycetota bacterium]
MAGVFRPVPRPPRRRPRLISGGFRSVPQAGRADVGLSGTSLSVKVAACGGVCAGGFGGAGQAVKTVAHAGVVDVGATGSATNKKVATPISAGVFGATATATNSRISPHTGIAQVSFFGRSTLRGPSTTIVGFSGTAEVGKSVAVAGACSVGFGTTAGASQKRIAASGRGYGGFGSKAATFKTIEVSGTSGFFPVGLSTSPLRAYGATDVGFITYSTARKVAPQGGRACFGGASAGNGRRNLNLGGRSGFGAGARCTSRSKVASVQGRGTVGFWCRGEAIRAGATTGQRVSPPYPLPAIPPLGSLVLWESTTPPGTTVLVETSVD